MRNPGGLPPGPGRLRAFGFVRRPFEFLDECARRYGDWFTVRFPGLAPFVFTSDPVAVREVFEGDPEELRAGEANAPLGAFTGPHSVLLLDGAAHLRERRLLLPPFHGERMQAYGRLMAEIADRTIDAWPDGRTFPIHASMRAITFEVILSAVFGLADGATRARLGALLMRVFGIFGSPLGALLGLRTFQVDAGPLSPWGRVVRLRRELEALLFAEFARRRAAGTAGRDDVLSLLLEARDEDGRPMADAALRDELVTLMIAGHETTAASLSWAVLRLLEHPEVMAKLRHELGAADGRVELVAQLPYLDAVVKEIGRLDPVVPNVARRLGSPLRIADHDLPAGVLVAPCIYLVHRRPELWPDPERFRPERFLGARPSPYTFFPFGGGTRRCIGAAFATYEMKIVLARLLARVELALAPGYRPRLVRRSIAFAPSEELPVLVTGRPAGA
jgi:cytochrome P450